MIKPPQINTPRNGIHIQEVNIMVPPCIGCTAVVGGVVNEDLMIICVCMKVFVVYIITNYIH